MDWSTSKLWRAKSLWFFSLCSYNLGKLAHRALKSIFIRCSERVKGYKIWCIDVNPSKNIINRDVIFNEEELISKKSVQRVFEIDIKGTNKLPIEVELFNQNDTHEATDSSDIIDR